MRVGILGPNGGGKSTMLAILAGVEHPDAGTVTRRRGLVHAFLPQHVPGDVRTPVAWVRAARPELAELEGELEAVERRLADPALASDLDAMARALAHQERLLARWHDQGGDRAESEGRTLLDELGLDDDALAMPTSELSGGQRKLVQLAACLARRPHVLMLDEPEAHLDMHRRDQLERIVDDFDGAVLMVSHDRHLLDACVGLDRRARQRPDPDLARRLLRLRRGAPARAREAAAAVRHAAEGDRATGGRGPALPALGAHHGQRARRQAGSRQADADRQDGEGRPPGAGAPQDGARAAQRRARRPAGDRARGRRRGVRPGRSGRCSTSSS